MAYLLTQPLPRSYSYGIGALGAELTPFGVVRPRDKPLRGGLPALALTEETAKQTLPCSMSLSPHLILRAYPLGLLAMDMACQE